jgi:hypothetical protein
MAKQLGGVPVVNDGSAIWTDVHMDDVVDLYLRVYDHAVKQSAAAPAPGAGVMKDATPTSDLPLSVFE